MTARVYLVGHGASLATREVRFPDDEALKASAVSALKASRGKLRSYGCGLACPSRGAREREIALGLEGAVETALQDCDYGRWRGLEVIDVAAREPEEFAAWVATLAVTHAAVVRAAIVRTFWRINVAPLSLARLSGHAGRWNLVALGPLAALS